MHELQGTSSRWFSHLLLAPICRLVLPSEWYFRCQWRTSPWVLQGPQGPQVAEESGWCLFHLINGTEMWDIYINKQYIYIYNIYIYIRL